MNFMTGFIVGAILGALVTCIAGWMLGRWLAQEEGDQPPDGEYRDHDSEIWRP